MLPAWAYTKEKKFMYGAASRLGASEAILSDEDAIMGFMGVDAVSGIRFVQFYIMR